MNVKTVRWLILFAAIGFIGIVFSQVFWIRKGLLINQSNFEDAVILSLEVVAEKIELTNWGTRKSLHPVERISPRSYIVNITERIDANLLHELLNESFANPFHNIDFSYEIYSTVTNELVFADTVYINESVVEDELRTLPVFEKPEYCFKVNFPQKPVVSSIMISVWVIAILILMATILFFGYSLNVIFKQARLSEFQKNFINNLAHEFKTPISTISISAEVLNESSIVSEPERLKNYTSIIKKENERLKHQVTKILQLAKLESDEIILSKSEFNINEVIDQLANAFRVKLKENDGSIQTFYHSNGAMLKADKVHFENVINTLLDNAVKYTEKTPSIDLITDSDYENIYVSVKDNGIGIEKEYQEKIFEKFFRIPTGNVHNVKGFGLGLNYVKMIAKAHKWQVHVYSETSKGSTFTLVIPIKNNK
jgi:two-component system phosphate regulon sensor histidine kinase PhoR